MWATTGTRRPDSFPAISFGTTTAWPPPPAARTSAVKTTSVMPTEPDEGCSGVSARPDQLPGRGQQRGRGDDLDRVPEQERDDALGDRGRQVERGHQQ